MTSQALTVLKSSEMAIQQQPVDRQLTIPALSVEAVLQQTALIKEIAQKVMQEDQHYGTIPGTPHPTLYQAGAQKLQLTFQIRTDYEVQTRELPPEYVPGLPSGHREVTVKALLRTAHGDFLGAGVGSCSTIESKYRYRKLADASVTEHSIPKSYWELKNPKDKQRMLQQIMDDASGRYTAKKVEGQWYIAKINDAEECENPNIADCYNTVLKIAKKRALVDGTLNVTAAGDTFTQDLEDLRENLEAIQIETGKPFVDPALEDNARREAQDWKEHAKREDQHREKQEKQEKEKPAKSSRRRDNAAKEEPKPEEGSGTNVGAHRPGSWEQVTVHVKSTVQNRRLGELTLAHYKAIWEKWVETLDWEADTITAQDKRLKAAVAMAIQEGDPEWIAERMKRKEVPPMETPGKKQEEVAPAAAGAAQEPHGPFGEPVSPEEGDPTIIEKLERMRSLILDAMMSEESFIAAARDKGLFEGVEGIDALNVTTLEDTTEEWIDQILDGWTRVLGILGVEAGEAKKPATARKGGK